MTTSRSSGADRAPVMAVVLTHNDQEELERCLLAIRDQSLQPQVVLVVDNGSSPPATVPGDSSIAAVTRLLRLGENLGPAGGYAAGLSEFLHSPFEFAWVMDDDVVADEGCLAALLETARSRATPALVWPRQRNSANADVDYPGWSGFLIPRETVERVGLPNAELFWWTEDTEYLQRRIPRAGFASVRCQHAQIRHFGGRTLRELPAWRVYYETRNSIYYRLYVQRLEHPIKLLRIVAALFVRSATGSPGRRDRLAMFAKGLLHGLFRRLGKRVHVD